MWGYRPSRVGIHTVKHVGGNYTSSCETDHVMIFILSYLKCTQLQHYLIPTVPTYIYLRLLEIDQYNVITISMMRYILMFLLATIPLY